MATQRHVMYVAALCLAGAAAGVSPQIHVERRRRKRKLKRLKEQRQPKEPRNERQLKDGAQPQRGKAGG